MNSWVIQTKLTQGSNNLNSGTWLCTVSERGVRLGCGTATETIAEILAPALGGSYKSVCNSDSLKNKNCCGLFCLYYIYKGKNEINIKWTQPVTKICY